MKSQLFSMDKLFKIGGVITGGALAVKIIEDNNPTKLISISNNIGKVIQRNYGLSDAIEMVIIGGVTCGVLKFIDNTRPTILYNRKAKIQDKITNIIIIVGTIGIITAIGKSLLFL